MLNLNRNPLMTLSTKKTSELIIAADLEEAFIGVGIRRGQSNIAVYSLSIAVDLLEEGGMNREEARNMLYDRVHTLDFGESTPIWVEEMSVDELRLLSIAPHKSVH